MKEIDKVLKKIKNKAKKDVILEMKEEFKDNEKILEELEKMKKELD